MDYLNILSIFWKFWNGYEYKWSFNFGACNNVSCIILVFYSSDDNFKVAFDWSRAVYSPDGTYAMAGSHDGTLFIWNIAKGKVERTLKEHTWVTKLVLLGPPLPHIIWHKTHSTVITLNVWTGQNKLYIQINGPVVRVAKYSGWPNIHSDQIFTVAKYSQWPNIYSGQIFTVAEYSQWPNIHSGRIFTVAKYSQWPNIHSGQIFTVAKYSQLLNIKRWQILRVNRVYITYSVSLLIFRHSILSCSWHPAGSYILSSEKQKKVVLWSDI